MAHAAKSVMPVVTVTSLQGIGMYKSEARKRNPKALGLENMIFAAMMRYTYRAVSSTNLLSQALNRHARAVVKKNIFYMGLN